MNRTLWTAVATLALASTPFVFRNASAEASKSVEQLDHLAFPIGEWTCSGKIEATEKNPGYATSGHAKVAKMLDGNWIEIRYDEEQTAANPSPYHVAQYIGYDEGKKHYVSVTLDNSGAPYQVAKSNGWNGDAIAFDTTVSISGKDTGYQDVFTKKRRG